MAETLIFFVANGQPPLLRFFNSTFLSFKRRVLAHFFRFQNDAARARPVISTLLAKFHCISLFHVSQDDVVCGCRICSGVDAAVREKCEVNARDCSSNDESFGADENGRHAVFNALDTMLKDSLERLKMM
ncbi:hypothetical protein CR513_00188, partial [Mucuna pruriens]